MGLSSRQPGASWPGWLMEHALSFVAADYRRPVGPVLTAAVLAVFAGLAVNQVGPLGSGLALALGLLATAPIAVIRKFPGPAIGIVLTASAGFVMFGRLSWSAAAFVGWMIALAACPLLLSRRTSVIAVGLTEIAVLLGPVGFGKNVTPWDAAAAEFLAVIAAWGVGEMLRARREAAAERAAAAERVRFLSERHMVARERASIARELHDVVAHHVSLIAVRAATAPYAVPELTEAGQSAFAEIADEARSALTELRVVLGLLRSPESAGAEASPQPTISDLDALVCRVAAAGAPVSLTASGMPRRLPASVELCCYRIVQEALTNAGRHAPGSAVLVELHYEPDALNVRVINDPPERQPVSQAAGHAGFGITGLRERVSMLRGEFRAGPDDSGGFSVCAVLPAAASTGEEP